MLSTMLEALLFALILAAPCLAAWAGARLLAFLQERRRRTELAAAQARHRAYVQSFSVRYKTSDRPSSRSGGPAGLERA